MNARIEEKIDNFLLKIKVESKDASQKGRSLIILDKNSELIGKKHNNSAVDIGQISSSTNGQSNSEDVDTQANKSDFAL